MKKLFTRWHQKQLQIQKWQINHESCQNNNNKKKTSKQTNKQTSKKQKVKITGTNYISRICLERNYHAAFMHTRFRNYLLRVHWIVLILSKRHITNRVFNGCVWKIVRLKSCCVSIHTYIYIYIFCFIYLFFLLNPIIEKYNQSHKNERKSILHLIVKSVKWFDDVHSFSTRAKREGIKYSHKIMMLK